MPKYSPGLAFIILVLSTSTGLPITQAVNPAMEEQSRWHGTLSSIRFLRRIMSLAWSKVAISAAFMIEFLMTLGPIPVQSPLRLSLQMHTLII